MPHMDIELSHELLTHTLTHKSASSHTHSHTNTCTCAGKQAKGTSARLLVDKELRFPSWQLHKMMCSSAVVMTLRCINVSNQFGKTSNIFTFFYRPYANRIFKIYSGITFLVLDNILLSCIVCTH